MNDIQEIKQLRKDIDSIIQRVKYLRSDDPLPMQIYGRESRLAIIKLQEAVMWLGMCLKAIDEYQGTDNNPYPDSKTAWEYKHVVFPLDTLEKRVEEIKAKGWEYVDCMSAKDDMAVEFHRPNNIINPTSDNLKL